MPHRAFASVDFSIFCRGFEQIGRRIKGDFRTAAAIFAALIAFVALAPLSEAADKPPIMNLPGQLDVSASGAATYSIPIVVPPGTAGMVPSLSLEYSSQAGDGIMGLGWSLSGMPSIGRCARNMAQDGVKGSVNYDANDKFCMEGQRLVAISGTYGANGTEYRTEIEGFSRVISYGTAGTGPSYFKVWTKSGQTMEFGNSTDSRVLATGIPTVRSWALNKVSDTKGNYLTVTYTNDTTNGVAYPTQIDYTGNAGASLTPYNSVRFTYNTSRPDQVTLYHAGSLTKNTVLLTNVKTYAGASVVRDYRITYELGTSLRRSRITQIQLCDGSSNCLAPTTFGWQGTRDTITLDQGYRHAICFFNCGSTDDIFLSEYTGDGLTDDLGADAACTGNTSKTVWSGDQSGNLTDPSLTLTTSPGNTSTLCLQADVDHTAIGDFNGDGYADFKIWDGSSHANFLLSDKANGFLKAINQTPPALPGPWPAFDNSYLGDFNGDGRTDFFQKSSGNGITWYSVADTCTTAGSCSSAFTSSSNGPGFSGTIVSTADFDGNGCSDILQQGNVRRINYFCNGVQDYILIPQFLSNDYVLAFGDFNGDGATDILAVKAAPNPGQLQFSTGTALVQSSYAPSDWKKYAILTADFNGDGKTDIALIADGVNPHYGNGTTSKIYLSTGDGFVLAATFSPPAQGASYPFKAALADINNDSIPDIVIDEQPAYNSYKFVFEYTPEFINSVTNGLGATSTITYDRLNQGTIYTKENTATYPQIDVTGAMYVVSRVESSDGIGGTYSTTYSYAGLKADQQGRGYLGFHQRIVTDLQTNVVETTTFRQDYPYIGLIASQTQVKGAVTLNSKTNTYAATSLGGTRYYVSLSQTVEVTNDLNGAAMPTITTAYQYDSYGNATQVSITTPDGASKVTTNTYTNDATNWLLGRLTSATQANSVPGDSGTRSSSFAYDAISGLLTQEVIEPGTSALRLQTDYVYDAFGNKTSVTISGVDIVTRTSSIGFDTKGEFATSATNALSQTATQQYDARLGLVTSATDANSLTATNTYDAFGRAILTVKPDGTRTSVSYAYCSGTNGGSATCPTGGVFVATATPYASDGTTQIGPQTKSYFDMLQRVIAGDTEGFDGSAIRQATQYDGLGRVAQASRPYFVSGGTPKWTVNTYDGIGRIIDVAMPNGAHEARTFNGLTTTKINDLGRTTTTVKNAQGLAATVTDPAGKVTTYTYDAFGNVKTITDSAGNVTTYTYDTRGRKTAVNDPDMGLWQYSYNVAGQLVSQTDAKNQTVTLTYDKLNRPTQRVETGLTSTWTYDTATHGIGLLASDSASNGAGHTYVYDTLSRLTTASTIVDGNTYSVATAYDSNGRVDTLTYPSGFAVKYVYTSRSYLSQLKDNATSSVLWTANTVNAELQITQQTAGNGVVTNTAYDADTGLMQTIQAGASNSIANFSYTFDHVGSLTNRTDGTQSLTENFTYDSLNRVTQYAIVGGSTKTVGYDDLGNITSKSDVGSYSYPSSGSARPHAIASITGTVNTIYTYDANGNMIAGQGRTVTYTAFNMADTITEGTTTIALAYDANHSRIKQTAPEGTTIYIAAAVERFAATSGLVQWNEYLFAGKALVGEHFTRSDSTVNTRYFITDHLGSVAILTDEAGAVVERLSYDAWGKRRYPNGSDDPTNSITSQTTKSFTGQEQIPDVGLINFNARIYDPLIGRFMTPDSVTQDIYLQQVLNKYSYCGNNPLSFTDPTGNIFGIDDFIIFTVAVAILSPVIKQIPILGDIAVIVASYECGGCAAWTSAEVTGIEGGSVGDMLKAYVLTLAQQAAFKEVGGFLKDNPTLLGNETLTTFVAHGIVGGAFSALQGGKFGSGFLSGGVATLGDAAETGYLEPDVVIHAALGGAASLAGGGKFENGAITGAFGYLFNRTLHRPPPPSLVQRIFAAIGDFVEGAGEFVGDFASAAAPPAILGTAAVTLCGDDPRSCRQPIFVVRAGLMNPRDTIRGTTLTPQGLYGFSVQSAPDVPVEELARGGYFPNAMISFTTVDQLRAMGYTLVFDTPGRGDYHSTVVVPNNPITEGQAAELQKLFQQRPNPFPVPK